MLSPDVFKEGFQALCSFLKKPEELDPAALYKFLSPRLSDGNFLDAVDRVLETQKFFPKPCELIEAANSVSIGKAGFEWNEFADFVTASESSLIDYRVTPTGYYAFRAIGGTMTIRNCSVDRLHYIKTQFIEAYLHAIATNKQIALPENPESKEVERMPLSAESRETLLRAINNFMLKTF